MTEQPLDFKGTVRCIRRSWWTVVVFVLVGLLAAAAYEVHYLPRYSATTLILLPQTSSVAFGTPGSAARPVTTDAKLATSAAVLLPAAKSVVPSDSLSQLQSDVKASGAASDVLAISATARSRTQAERLANAVASKFIDFITANGSSAVSSVIAGLEAEEKQLNAQLGHVRQEAAKTTRRVASEGASSPAGLDDRALLTGLTSQELSITLQVNSVKSQIASAQLGQVSANLETEVIQRATTATPPSPFSLAMPPGAGLLGGAFVGSMIVLAASRVRRRAWTRDGLATALGAPVVLSLDVTRRRTLGSWTQLFECHDPGPVERWSVLRALHELGMAKRERRNLTILTFERDHAAATEAAQVAVTAAASGVSTAISVLARDGVADTLQALCAKYERDGNNPRSTLTMHGSLTIGREQTAELSVTVLAADIRNPEASLVTPLPGASCVVAISAGFASPDDLTRAALAAASVGLPVSAVFVANPEARDDTTGRRLPPAGGTKSFVEPVLTRRIAEVVMEPTQ